MRILIVDDLELIVEDLTEKMQKLLPDARVDGRQTAAGALATAEVNRYDLALLDIDMPGMNGLELARRLQAMQPLINIIFVTGFEEYALDSYSVFASAFLVKPVNEEQLRGALEHLRHPIRGARDDTLMQEYAGGNHIGQRIKALRKARGISRKDLADQLNVTVQTVSRWETGSRLPDVVTFLDIARVLDVRLVDMVQKDSLQ